ncbi:MAG: thioredoxin domain-containing protein [Bdellovibrio sp.]|nr:thioredoxin domain-containing protein [Bdellovibrio sp.]
MSYSVLRKNKVLSLGVFCTLSLALGVFFISACSESAKAKIKMVTKQAPRPGVVAKIGNEEITYEALIGDDKMDFFELQKREFELKMERLNKLMVEKLIGAEAKKANLSLDEFISKKVIGGDLKISEKEYKNFVSEKHIPEAQINAQIKEKIMAYLQNMKKEDKVKEYVAKLSDKSPIEVYFSKPKMVVPVDAGNGPTFGKAGAPVTIIEFSDFECPFCSRAAETVAQIKKKYGNKVKLTFRHFPLPMHPNARPASEASMCINEQSTDKFWKFHDLAFKNQTKLDKAALEKYAKDAGADVKKFNECLASKKFADAIQKDMDYGSKLGVKSTPTFFINGQLLSGALPIESFSEVIDDELAEKK